MASEKTHQDTIAAVATAPGKGGVGIIRVSGAKAFSIAKRICNRTAKNKQAQYAYFKDKDEQVIDSGLVLFFQNPASFTGEDVVELHGHGGPVILDILLKRVLELGARQAKPGEFSERAFLNDKLDLAQAEAIADLIDSSTAQAARGAMRSLQGEFSNKINTLLKELIHLRMYVEAAIDFPEEEIDFLADERIHAEIQNVLENLTLAINQAGQGRILKNGLHIVLAGKPNAGKSSLLNTLSGEEAAIVTDTPGTTRDTISTLINIDGLPVHVVDTAGLRESDDVVEKIGVERAKKAINAADHVLYLIDASDELEALEELDIAAEKITYVYNKIDLVDIETDSIKVSAKHGNGIEALKLHLKQLAGFEGNGESLFTARRRHITALENAQLAVSRGLQQLQTNNAGELLADELLQAQNYLNEITGEFSADDLLGEIFSGFCIGK